VCLCLAVAVLGHSTERHHVHHHRHVRKLSPPLDFNLEKATEPEKAVEPAPAAGKHDSASLDELFQQQAAIQTSAGLSASGPLTRADFGGEAPYEVENLEEESNTPAAAPVENTKEVAVKYQELSSPSEDVGAVANLQTTTVPTMLSDGRLVRVPMEETNGQGSEVKLDESNKPELASPDIAGGADAASPKFTPDLNLIQTEAGLGTGEEAQLKTTARAPTPPFAAKKVRVSSLVGGILSSVLSSVLTRGMEFTSAKSQ